MGAEALGGASGGRGPGGDGAGEKDQRPSGRTAGSPVDRIQYLGQCYLADGEISFDDRRRLHRMHDAYHTGLNGNGDLDVIMAQVDRLPLKH